MTMERVPGPRQRVRERYARNFGIGIQSTPGRYVISAAAEVVPTRSDLSAFLQDTHPGLRQLFGFRVMRYGGGLAVEVPNEDALNTTRSDLAHTGISDGKFVKRPGGFTPLLPYLSRFPQREFIAPTEPDALIHNILSHWIGEAAMGQLNLDFVAETSHAAMDLGRTDRMEDARYIADTLSPLVANWGPGVMPTFHHLFRLMLPPSEASSRAEAAAEEQTAVFNALLAKSP